MASHFRLRWSFIGLATGISFAVTSSSATAQRIGPEFAIDLNTGSGQHQPSVAADATGKFVVVWVNYGQDGFQYGVIGRRLGATGNPLGGEFQVNTYTTGSQYRPSVSARADGGFVVVWTGLWDQDGSDAGIFGQRFEESGTPLGSEFRVNSYTTGDQLLPAVASDPAGNFLVVWSSYHVSGADVFGQLYDVAGGPVGSEMQINSFTTGVQRSASVAADGAGNFVVVWQSSDQDGSGSGIVGRRISGAGSPLGPEFPINTHTTSSQAYPNVAARSSGEFVVVWQSAYQDGSGAGIFGRRFDAAGLPAAGEFQVNTYTTNQQTYPVVAVSDSGSFVVTWQSSQQDGWAEGIYGRVFGPSGSPVSDEFRVNSHTTGGQESPAVAASGSGNFLASWTSLTSAPGYLGVRGQLLGVLAFSDGFESGDVCAWSASTGGGACP